MRIFHFALLVLPLLFSCKSHFDEASPSIECKVAIITPLSGSQSSRYKEVVEWCCKTFDAIKGSAKLPLTLSVEWYDEFTEDLSSLAESLAQRNDLAAIIGPDYSRHISIVAEACRKTQKPLLLPLASSEEQIRQYAVSEAGGGDIKRPFLWAIGETDISQCEVLLTKIASYGYTSVSVLSSTSTYGKTFFEWTPFFSDELNIMLADNIRCITADYDKENDATETKPVPLAEGIDTVLKSKSDAVICAMEDNEDIAAVLAAWNAAGDTAPKLFFTDGALTDDFLALGEQTEGAEGTSMYADPNTGFPVIYQSVFNRSPVNGEAEYYDAILLVLAAMAYRNAQGTGRSADNASMNDALSAVTTKTTSTTYTGGNWTKTGMVQLLQQYANGICPVIEGASGSLVFDSEVYTTLTHATYIHWCIIDGNIATIDFVSSNKKGRTSESSAWYWQQTTANIFSSAATDLVYPEKHKRVAVVIAASKGWKNYRHQADALKIYRILKAQKFTDDNIILILQDDIAHNIANKKYGEIYVLAEGENLYDDALSDAIDYKPTDLEPKDVKAILLGQTSEKVPLVLQSDEYTDIFLFWAGHGNNRQGNEKLGSLEWADSDTGFTTELMEETLQTMTDEKRFRKLFIVTEACYAKSVMHVAEGKQGIFVLTAANGKETSFADVRSTELGVWLSNRFTHGFIFCIEKGLKDAHLSYADLYIYLVKHTLGSHVCAINDDKFGNMYLNSPLDFFTP